jgi:hypothetical protein
MGNISLESSAQVDTTTINKLFQDLRMTSPEATKAVRGALRRSIVILRSSVRRAAATVTSNPKKQKLVDVAVYRSAKGALVSIKYGDYVLDNKGNKRFFTLRFLDKGTEKGPNKKGKPGYYGRMHGATPIKPFFKAAVNSALPEAEGILSDTIVQFIERIVSKRK